MWTKVKGENKDLFKTLLSNLQKLFLAENNKLLRLVLFSSTPIKSNYGFIVREGRAGKERSCMVKRYKNWYIEVFGGGYTIRPISETLLLLLPSNFRASLVYFWLFEVTTLSINDVSTLNINIDLFFSFHRLYNAYFYKKPLMLIKDEWVTFTLIKNVK